MAPAKTPKAVSDAIKKLDVTDQVTIQTYIAKLKSTIEELEGEVLKAKDGDPHAHYHGHEKCTSDHGHYEHGHHGTEEEVGGTAEGHDHSHAHDSGHHEHTHTHADHKGEKDKDSATGKDEDGDIPAWKKKAMESGGKSDPMAAPFGGSWNSETSVDATATAGESKPFDEETAESDESSHGNEPPFPPLYESGDDFDKATTLKMEAGDLKSAADYEGALEKYTEAIVSAEPSALLYANRADVLFRLKRPRAAVRDCDAALALNPDSAKALRIRGRARKALGDFTSSLKDLSASQAIDYDDVAAEDLKFVSEKVKEMEHEKVMKKLEEEERLRKRASEIKKAQEEAKKKADAAKASASRSAPPSSAAGGGGMPGMGGGMPGGPGGSAPPGMAGMMSALMSDPELAAGMQNPKIIAAFSELMSAPGGAMGLMGNPEKLQKMMEDPEVGPFMQKLMEKLGPMMMGGGAGAGAAGMPDMSGTGGMGGTDDQDDDIPDLDDLPDLE